MKTMRFTVRDLLGKIAVSTDVRIYWVTAGAIWEGFQGDSARIHPLMFNKGKYVKVGNAVVLDVRLDSSGKTIIIRCEDMTDEEAGK